MSELYNKNIIPIITIEDIYGPRPLNTGEPLVGMRIIGGEIESASYKSSISGARLEIFPSDDPTIGMVNYNSAGTTVFKTIVDGTDSGDVVIGNYAGGQGALYDSSLDKFTFTGALEAGSIHIPDEDTTANSFHTDTGGNSWWGCTQSDWTSDHDNANAYVLNTGVAKFQNAILTTSIIIDGIQAGSEISIQGWQSTLVFTASDYRVVGWSAGNDETITLMDGTVYTFTAGNTGNMAALTYIYLDIATSTTVLQTSTTASDAVGTGKILVGVAQNNSDTSSNATYQVFGGTGGQMLGVDYIAANETSTNEFVANTANIKDAIITNAKIVTLAVTKLTAGTINSQAIILGVTATEGDCYIAGGTIDMPNWRGDGCFILGLDDSDSDKAKFFIGNYTANKYLSYYEGGDLVLKGGNYTGNSDVANIEASIFSTNRGGPSQVNITQAGLNISIDDANGNRVFNALGETWGEGILELKTSADNDIRCLKLDTNHVTAATATAYFINRGLSEVLILETTNGANSDTILTTIGVGATWHAEFNGAVKIGGELEINTSDQALDINSSREGGAVTIDETATAGTSKIISITSARPCGGILLDLNHTTNIQRTIDIRYAGIGLSGEGIISINSENNSFVGACLAMSATGGTHINFSGDTNNGSPTDGDLWFNGTELYLRVGATTYKLDKTAI